MDENHRVVRDMPPYMYNVRSQRQNKNDGGSDTK